MKKTIEKKPLKRPSQGTAAKPSQPAAAPAVTTRDQQERVARAAENQPERVARAAQQEQERVARAAPKQQELFVFAMSLGSDQRRPVLILKDATGEMALPVWLNPVDASFALGDNVHDAYAAHSVAIRMMRELGLRLERCVFTECKGHHQLVRLEFTGNESLRQLEARASDAMSLCLAASVRFFASPEVIARSREMDAELLGIEAGLLSKPEIGFRNHKYVM